MQIKIFSLKFDPLYGGFNDETIQIFAKDKEIVSIKDYFFVKNEVPYLTLIVQYAWVHSKINSEGFQPKQEDWRKLLTESDLGLFDLLRNWRLKRSKKEGVPPYVLFSNAQLAKIVTARPQFLTDLSKIDGVGQAKIDKYGSEILEITKINLDVSNTTA